MASLTCRDERYLGRARGGHLYRSYHMLPSGCTLARPRWGWGEREGWLPRRTCYAAHLGTRDLSWSVRRDWGACICLHNVFYTLRGH